MVETKQGTVSAFKNKEGYGWITPSDGGEGIFVHMNDVIDSWTYASTLPKPRPRGLAAREDAGGEQKIKQGV